MSGNQLPIRPAVTLEPDCSDDIKILERNIQQQFYDDVASDIYTECDVTEVEDQIISYLNNTCLKELNTTTDVYISKRISPQNNVNEELTTNNKLIDVNLQHKPTDLSARQSLKYINRSKSCSVIFNTLSEKEDITSQNLKNLHSSTYIKMNSYPSADSGLESGLLESQMSNHKTSTATDCSMTESHLYNLIENPINNDTHSVTENSKLINAPVLKNEDEIIYDSPCHDSVTKELNKEKYLLQSINPKTGKQRQNIEIVLLDSSLSSALNPWKSYTPNLSVKEVCEAFLLYECLFSNENIHQHKILESEDASKKPSDKIKEASCSSNESFIIRYRPLPYTRNVDEPSHDTVSLLFSKSKHNKEVLSPNHTKDSTLSEAEKIKRSDTQTEDSIIPYNEFLTSTPNNSIMSFNEKTHVNDRTQIKSAETNWSAHKTETTGYYTAESLEIEDSQLLEKLNDDRISETYTAETEEKLSIKSLKPLNSSTWVVDMSSKPKLYEESGSSNSLKNTDHGSEPLKKESIGASTSSSNYKSSHKYFIDLTKLPETSPLKNQRDSSSSNSIFSMYFDIGETNSLKQKKKKSFSGIKKTGKVDTNEPPDFSFEIYESLCDDPNISLSKIINKTIDSSENIEQSDKRRSGSIAGSEAYITAEGSLLLDSPMPINEKQKPVKLADLENSYPKLDILSTNNEDAYEVRMTRSIPDNNWREREPVSRTSGSQRFLSFHSENATSLNRLFPNLKKELSKSMPGSLSSTTVSSLRFGLTPTPGDSQEHISDMSHSSIHSAGGRSVFENSTTEDNSLTSSILKNCQSRLGQDLLRMFIEEIASDVIVEVDGIKIKAHKCILSSRCQYFAAILSGTWVESAGNVITLPPFSYNVVHFALCHIYAGIAVLPKCINIVELTTVADMLCLEGLKEVIVHKLKDDYCHNFHMPCVVCTAGVLECFSLSSLNGLDDLYRKCLQWITKYFSKIWPTRSFGLLPKELLDKCYQQQIINMSMDNLFETVYGCGLAAASLEGTRSVETVRAMCRRLVTAAAQFAAPQLEAALRAAASVPPDAPDPALAAIHECVNNAIEWAPPEEACRAYAFLSALLRDVRDRSNCSSQVKMYDNFLHANAGKWCLLCEKQLVSGASSVLVTQAFKDLSLSLKKRLRELGCIRYGARPKLTVPTLVQDVKKKNSSPSPPTTFKLNIDHVRTSFIPYAPKPIATMTKGFVHSSKEVHGHSKVSLPKVRMTKAQEERLKYNMSRSQQTYNKSVATGPIRASSLSNVKSRVTSKEVGKPTPTKPSSRKPEGNSESSGRLGARPCESTSQDSLATSSRPRTGEPPAQNNKYATFTKSKSLMNRPPQEQETKSRQQPMMKTRIPVYTSTKSPKCEKQTNVTTRNVRNINKATTSNVRRNLVGSLMNATKSSSAKIVPKVVKEQHNTPKRSKDDSMNKSECKSVSPEKNVGGIERSETFLKDKPTFGDKTTNID